MVDLETFGTGRDAAIVSVGAVRFDPFTGEVDNAEPFTFHQKVQLSGDIGKLDASTVKWWLEQSPEARAALLSDPRLPLSEVLNNFGLWLCRDTVKGFWANGPTFDEMILRDAFARLNVHWPIEFRASRDCRTVFEMGKRLDVPKPSNSLQHDALADAIYQARYVCAIYKDLGLSWRRSGEDRRDPETPVPFEFPDRRRLLNRRKS